MKYVFRFASNGQMGGGVSDCENHISVANDVDFLGRIFYPMRLPTQFLEGPIEAAVNVPVGVCRGSKPPNYCTQVSSFGLISKLTISRIYEALNGASEWHTHLSDERRIASL